MKKKIEAENKNKNVILEKKWISQTRDLNSKTFNYHLQRKQTESMIKLQSIWEPPKIKARKNLEESVQMGQSGQYTSQNQDLGQSLARSQSQSQSPKKTHINTVVYTAQKVATIHVPSSIALQPQTPIEAFDGFKLKLKADTMKFYELAEAGRKAEEVKKQMTLDVSNGCRCSSKC